MDLKLTPYVFFFFYFPVEWQGVTKRFLVVRLGVRDSLRNTHYKQSSCCYVCRGTEVVQLGSYRNRSKGVRWPGYLNCKEGR